MNEYVYVPSQLEIHKTSFDDAERQLMMTYELRIDRCTEQSYADVKEAVRNACQSFRELVSFCVYGDDASFSTDVSHQAKANYFSSILAATEKQYSEVRAEHDPKLEVMDDEARRERADWHRDDLHERIENIDVESDEDEVDAIVDAYDDILASQMDGIYETSIHGKAWRAKLHKDVIPVSKQIFQTAAGVAIGALIADRLRSK